MIYATLALAAVCLLLVVVILALLRVMRDQYDAQDHALQAMADRVQAPSRIPLRDASSDYVIPERTPDEWNQVGQVDIDPERMLADEALNG